MTCLVYTQWNLSNPDTIRPRFIYTNMALGEEESVLFGEVSVLRGSIVYPLDLCTCLVHLHDIHWYNGSNLITS